MRTNGSTADAQKYLDEVRDRAYNVANGGSAPEVTVSLDNILDERRKEFFGDGLRYWDLVRTGNAAKYLGPLGWKPNGKLGGQDHWFWMIPESEVNNAASTDKPLTQNPGY